MLASLISPSFFVPGECIAQVYRHRSNPPHACSTCRTRSAAGSTQQGQYFLVKVVSFSALHCLRLLTITGPACGVRHPSNIKRLTPDYCSVLTEGEGT